VCIGLLCCALAVQLDARAGVYSHPRGTVTITWAAFCTCRHWHASHARLSLQDIKELVEDCSLFSTACLLKLRHDRTCGLKNPVSQ
jgi:hypothetical protein